jgi:hypothetical protein
MKIFHMSFINSQFSLQDEEQKRSADSLKKKWGAA